MSPRLQLALVRAGRSPEIEVYQDLDGSESCELCATIDVSPSADDEYSDRRWHIPFNAAYLMCIVAAILSLVELGSDTAFNILVSLSTLGIMSTYLISIGCVLVKRLRHQQLPYARWSLGRYGMAINAYAVLYSLFIVVLCCFPLNLPVTTESAQWAPLIWVAVIGLAGVVYVLHGRRNYTPPVDFVEGKRRAGVELQQSA